MRRALERLRAGLNHSGNKALTWKLTTRNRSQYFSTMKGENTRRMRSSETFYPDNIQHLPIQHRIGFTPGDTPAGRVLPVIRDQHQWCTKVREDFISEV